MGNSPSELVRFENWLGKRIDQISAHTGRANWKNWIGSIKWSVDLWSPLNKPIRWTIAGNRNFYEQAAKFWRHRADRTCHLHSDGRRIQRKRDAVVSRGARSRLCQRIPAFRRFFARVKSFSLRICLGSQTDSVPGMGCKF